jgi:membrane-associated protease RseP (regulator of RpoE activity)
MADGFASAFRPARMRLRKSWSSCIRALGEKIIHLGWNPQKIHGATDSVISWLVSWPRVLFKFLDSVQHVSISIALLNALPIYGLDGQLALVQFIRIWLLSSPPPLVPASLRGREPSEQEQAARERHHDWNAVHMRQRRFSRFILVLGSALAIFNCALGFAAVFMNGP